MTTALLPSLFCVLSTEKSSSTMRVCDVFAILSRVFVVCCLSIAFCVCVLGIRLRLSSVCLMAYLSECVSFYRFICVCMISLCASLARVSLSHWLCVSFCLCLAVSLSMFLCVCCVCYCMFLSLCISLFLSVSMCFYLYVPLSLCISL